MAPEAVAIINQKLDPQPPTSKQGRHLLNTMVDPSPPTVTFVKISRSETSIVANSHPVRNKYKAMTPQQLFGNSLGISAGANDGFFYYLQNIRYIDRFCYIFSETSPPPLFNVFGHCSSGNGNNWNIFSLGCFL